MRISDWSSDVCSSDLQHRCADNQREHSQIEEDRACYGHSADQRHVGIVKMGREERIAEEPSATASHRREEQANPDPTQWPDRKQKLHLASAPHTKLKKKGDRNRNHTRQFDTHKTQERAAQTK